MVEQAVRDVMEGRLKRVILPSLDGGAVEIRKLRTKVLFKVHKNGAMILMSEGGSVGSPEPTPSP